jgi:hypothetical protein
MSIESEFFTWLKTNVPLVSNRVYALTAPQDVVNPYLVYQVIDDIPDYTHQGASGLADTRVQITLVDDDFVSVIAVADQLETALSGFKGTLTTIPVVALKDIETQSQDNDSGLFWITQDYILKRK